MSRPRTMPTVLVLTLVLLPLLGEAVRAAVGDDPTADDPQTWALVPASDAGPDERGRLEYTLEPGTRVEDHVAVRNLGESELQVDVYAQDATGSIDNAFEVATPEDDALRVGAWLHLETTTVTVPPRSAVVVSFTMDVPADAEPGDHAGAILAASVASQSVNAAAVQVRTGTRVYVRVAGPVHPSLEVDRLDGDFHSGWGPFSTGGLDVEATVENTGDVRLTPTGQVTVRSLFGWWTTTTATTDLGELLPQGAATTTGHAAAPLLGPLWVTVTFPEVQSRDQDVSDIVVVTSRTKLVWAVPWTSLVALALLTVAFVVAGRNLRRRRKARRVALDLGHGRGAEASAGPTSQNTDGSAGDDAQTAEGKPEEPDRALDRSTTA